MVSHALTTAHLSCVFGDWNENNHNKIIATTITKNSTYHKHGIQADTPYHARLFLIIIHNIKVVKSMTYIQFLQLFPNKMKDW